MWKKLEGKPDNKLDDKYDESTVFTKDINRFKGFDQLSFNGKTYNIEELLKTHAEGWRINSSRATRYTEGGITDIGMILQDLEVKAAAEKTPTAPPKPAMDNSFGATLENAWNNIKGAFR